MGRVNIRNIKTGETRSIPEDALAAALHTKEWTVETTGEAGERAVSEGTREALVPAGLEGEIEAAIYGLGRGVFLGGTDVLANLLGDADKVQALREAHPDISTTTEVAGALLPALASGGSTAAGSAARALPAGRAAAVGTGIAKRGAGRGVARETVYGALGGAAEGAAVGAGQYISEVALTDKDLSAEGFFGAAAGGGMWGGVPGAAIGFTAGALTSAKRLFAKADVTEQAAKEAERAAVGEIDGVLKDTDELEATARAKVSEHRRARTQVDPAAAAHAEAMRAERLAKAQAQTAAAQARAEGAAIRLDRLKARGKAAVKEPGPEAVAPAAPEPPTPQAPPVGPTAARRQRGKIGGERTATPAADLEATLAESTARLEAGEPIESLTAQARGVDTAPAKAADEGTPVAAPGADEIERGEQGAGYGLYSPRRPNPFEPILDIEQEIDNAIADLSPEARRLRDAANEVRDAKAEARDWISSVRAQADAKREGAIASGKLSRIKDVERFQRPGAVSMGAEVEGIRPDAVSRMRRPYSNEELADYSARHPVIRDFGDEAHIARFGSAPEVARDDLAERILTGRTDPSRLEAETLIAIGGRLETVGSPVGPEGIVGAVTRRNPDVNPDTVSALRARLGVGDQPLPFDVSEVGSVARNAPDIQEQIATALRGRLDMPDDVVKAIPALQRLERAEADLVEVLGDSVPPGSARRAAAYRKAMADFVEEEGVADAIQAQAIGEEMSGVVLKEQARKGFAGRAADVAAALDVMASLGIPGLPNAHDIPVIGPVLSLYLKGRAAMAVWRRLGGKLPATADTEIASKAAGTRDRMREAALSLLDAGARGARRARPGAASAATILGERLFADDHEGRYRAPPNATPAEVWALRADELQRSLQPGAMERAVRARVPTGDPLILQSITATALRAAEYLDRKAPKPPPGSEWSQVAWAPPPSERATFARIVEATRDPAAVMERAITGDVSVEAMEAIRAVYPRLYAEAQTELLTQLSERNDIPYRRRQQIATLFQLPIDPTADPSFAAKMQEGFSPPAPTPPPAPAMPPAPSPAIAAPVDLSTGMMLQEQT